MPDGVSADKEQLPIVLNIVLAVVNAVGSAIGVFVIDTLGRRYMILRSLPGIIITLIIIATSMDMQKADQAEDGSKVAHHIYFFAGVLMYLVFYAIGFACAPWAIAGEIFPIHLSSTAVSIATAAYWLASFLMCSLFLSGTESDSGKTYTFVILALFCVVAFIFVYFMVPETAGKTIEENVFNIIGLDLHLNEEGNSNHAPGDD